jgi:hypothetical protein
MKGTVSLATLQKGVGTVLHGPSRHRLRVVLKARKHEPRDHIPSDKMTASSSHNPRCEDVRLTIRRVENGKQVRVRTERFSLQRKRYYKSRQVFINFLLHSRLLLGRSLPAC